MRKTSFYAISVVSVFVLLANSCNTPSSHLTVQPAMIKGAEPVGMDTCGFCHEEQMEHFKYTAHARLFISEGDREVMGCEACHGAGSLHVEADGSGGRFIVNPQKDPETCYNCHLWIKAAFNLRYHHPVREGHMNCTNCHDPHGEDIYKAKEMKMGRENEVCGQCHRQQSRTRVFEHEALRDGCTICHRPHGSINDKLLVENDNNLCLKCHAQIAIPGTVPIGDFSHTAILARGSCWSAGCHTAVHGSDINPHLRY